MRFVLFFIFLALLSACGGKEFKIEIVNQSQHCSSESEQIELITTTQALEGVFDVHRLQTNPAERNYNFDQFVYVFVSAGIKRSAGYRYQLLDNKIEIDDKNIVLPLLLKAPYGDGRKMQLITSPCVLVKIDKNGVELSSSDLNISLPGNASVFNP